MLPALFAEFHIFPANRLCVTAALVGALAGIFFYSVAILAGIVMAASLR